MHNFAFPFFLSPFHSLSLSLLLSSFFFLFSNCSCQPPPAMPTFSELWGELRATKVKDAPSWVRSKATGGSFQKAAHAAGEAYGKKYLLPGRSAPVFHVMIALGVLGYALEYSHLKGEPVST